MQTKRGSFQETCVNTLIGFGVTYVFSPLIYSMCGIKTTATQLGLATLYFTILSIIRGYVIRRFFNKRIVNRDKRAFTPEGKDAGSRVKIKDKRQKNKKGMALYPCPPHKYLKLNGVRVCQSCGEVEGRI